MQLEPAPFYDDVAEGWPLGDARWVRTSDGVRIRVATWRPDEGDAVKGTILLLPGRTEHIEKYHQTAGDFARAGYVTFAIDWRGQGIADRVHPNAAMGHVESFTDYQTDFAAAVEAAKEMDLPRPWHLLGHSMGGQIGLRALIEGADVVSCAFTGPMWDIYFPEWQRGLIRVLARVMDGVGLGNMLSPSTKIENYVIYNGFDDNMLTRDRAQFDVMHHHYTTHPQMSLGGPSVRWLRQALHDCDSIAALPAPDVPCVTFLGTNERIVSKDAIRSRMAGWSNGELVDIQDGEHEVLMEVPATRECVISRIVAHFDAHGSA